MKHALLWLLCATVIASAWAAPVVFSQSTALSGTWTGTIVADGGSDRFQLVFALKFDGNRVSGSAGPSADNHNGTITSGSLDPSTGALKLEVDVKDGEQTNRAVFDGRLVDHTAVGTFDVQQSRRPLPDDKRDRFGQHQPGASGRPGSRPPP